MSIGTGWIVVRPILENARRLSTSVPAYWADSMIVSTYRLPSSLSRPSSSSRSISE